MQAGRVKHRVPTFGYVITECTRPGKLNVEKLKELGVKPGPLYATIKGGKEITSPSGHIVSFFHMHFISIRNNLNLTAVISLMC